MFNFIPLSLCISRPISPLKEKCKPNLGSRAENFEHRVINLSVDLLEKKGYNSDELCLQCTY